MKVSYRGLKKVKKKLLFLMSFIGFYFGNENHWLNNEQYIMTIEEYLFHVFFSHKKNME